MSGALQVIGRDQAVDTGAYDGDVLGGICHREKGAVGFESLTVSLHAKELTVTYVSGIDPCIDRLHDEPCLYHDSKRLSVDQDGLEYSL